MTLSTLCASAKRIKICVFGLTVAEYKKILGNRGVALATEVKTEVSKHFKKECQLQQVHVLFHWNDHSFFTYHRDDKGHVAVVVNLAPACTTDFHVAGAAEPATMKWPGHAHTLLTNVFHRSGTAPRRCIKLVFFIDLITPQNLDESNASTSTAAQVKPEVKPEVESDVKPEQPSAD